MNVRNVIQFVITHKPSSNKIQTPRRFTVSVSIRSWALHSFDFKKNKVSVIAILCWIIIIHLGQENKNSHYYNPLIYLPDFINIIV